MDRNWRTVPARSEADAKRQRSQNVSTFKPYVSIDLSLLLTGTPSSDLTALANLFGIIYQIQDDYLNLQSKNYSTNKGFCEDLTEGKFSFPIIHSIRSDPSNKEILNILKQKTRDVTLKEYAVNYMRTQTNSFAYCKTVIKSFDGLARAEIARLRNGSDAIETEQLEMILSVILSIN